MACLVPRPFLGFSAVIAAKRVMGSAFDFSWQVFPCAFALSMLCHDPRAATTVENLKKRLGARQPDGLSCRILLFAD